ncbi:hypothetical protein BDW68DRAFT_154807 [Aspergillus falconensis]
MAPRPELYPLQTPKHITFPSELQEYLRPTNPSPACNDGKGPSVPPPLAYTEFLKALSPVFGSPPESATTSSPYGLNKQLPSPQSLPSTASTASFSGNTATATKTHRRTRSGPPTPLNVPRSAAEAGQFRRLRMSPSYLYSPGAVDSPKSAHAVRSPYPPAERRVRYVDSPGSAARSITIQHIVTHTVTLKRVPSLAPPPKGKRRRMTQAKQ